MMDQSLQAVADLLLELKQANEAEASLFGGGVNFGVVQLNLSEQEIKNQVQQIMESLCSADVTNVQNGNMVYARNSKTGNIAFKQEGNAKADCVMENTASSIANLRAKNDQSNGLAASLGGFGAFLFFIVALAVVFGIINKNKGGNSGGASSGSSGAGQQSFNMRQLSSAYGR